MQYAFKNRILSVFFTAFDTLGALPFFYLRFKPAPLSPKRILVVRLDHIGDFIATTPVIRALKERFPAASIVVAVNPALSAFAKTYPYIDEILEFDAAWFKRPKVGVRWADVSDLAARLKKGAFELAVDPRGDFFSICALFLAGIPFRIGYGITGAGFLLHRQTRIDPAAGVIERNLAVLAVLPGLIDITAQLPDVFFTPTDQAKVEKLLLDKKASVAAAIVLHPFAGTRAKQWPLDSFQRLIDVLHGQGRVIFVVGTKKDTHAFNNTVDLRGQLSLNELSFLIKRSGLFVGLDSGPAHIAIATKTASVIICSGTNRPELWLPKAPFAKLLYHNVHCKPCGLVVCPEPKHYCMEAVSVEEVVMKINSLKY